MIRNQAYGSSQPVFDAPASLIGATRKTVFGITVIL
jgi:hypothetical protein